MTTNIETAREAVYRDLARRYVVEHEADRGGMGCDCEICEDYRNAFDGLDGEAERLLTANRHFWGDHVQYAIRFTAESGAASPDTQRRLEGAMRFSAEAVSLG